MMILKPILLDLFKNNKYFQYYPKATRKKCQNFLYHTSRMLRHENWIKMWFPEHKGY